MASPKILIRELRAEFLTASVIPVLMAVAAARYETGSWSPGLFILTVLGAALLHLGTNTANDYFDHLSGADEANVEYARPFTGGTRFIQEGLLSPREVLTLSIALFAGALAVGIFLIIARGWFILALGLIGLFLGYFYTAPPIKLAHRGLGEIAVSTGYGLIPVGAYFVQTGQISLPIIISAIPMALLVTGIIVINEFQDYRGDMSAGKKTLVVRLGRKRSVRLFASIMIAAYIPVIAGVAMGLIPRMMLIGLLPIVFVVKAIITATRQFDDPVGLVPANGATILSHALTGLLLAAAWLLAG
ncbi:MAG: 1,4-dihydroxy-2-naphthoate octaprenyltransferase [Candidatus Krumholzibacteria bacterium]|nr:1,4-dihydroxy-2-naphthoate octaprenyltransferase [Candidatus Krumholzibacteria bacterium]